MENRRKNTGFGCHTLVAIELKIHNTHRCLILQTAMQCLDIFTTRCIFVRRYDDDGIAALRKQKHTVCQLRFDDDFDDDEDKHVNIYKRDI